MAMSSASAGEGVDHSLQNELRNLLLSMAIIPTVIVFLRAWSRALLPLSTGGKSTPRFWWDDWCAFIAAALNIALCGMSLKLIDLGLGLHIDDVPPDNVERFLKLLWIIYYIFDTGTAMAKSSALFFYARVFGSTNSRFRYALWVVHAMNVAWTVTILFHVIFMCTPIEKAWKVTLPGNCVNTGLLWLGSGASSLGIDILILLLPLPMLWRLQMKPHRKLLITVVFITGYL
ncbi:hypothetical protein F5Y18DRAFT_419999 [Xylariaceae sp. FL1019]|nr:hypothetical protein F5Y18DRAFT_419999 [Xylariaceae sp. FL1019]